MDIGRWLACVALCGLVACREAPRQFAVSGVVKELKAESKTIIIQHEAIPNYMPAMTMPFRVKAPGELEGLLAGDRISFRLLVTDTESWIDRILKTGHAAAEFGTNPPPAQSHHPLQDFPFTNELGQAVSLKQFRGKALAITFVFTRCPIPDYCPRLSQNFQTAAKKLSSMPGAPTNWHFLSVTFDPEFDTPPVLKAYAKRYGYDPARWSFLTGPADKIGELVRLSGVDFQREGASFNHDLRTLIIDPAGTLTMNFPVGGDLSDAIVEEIIKAAAVPNKAP